jgi:hypothetical protein
VVDMSNNGNVANIFSSNHDIDTGRQKSRRGDLLSPLQACEAFNFYNNIAKKQVESKGG